MRFFYVKTNTLGSAGDLFKAKDAEDAAFKAAKKWPRANKLLVWEIREEDGPQVFLPETDVFVTGVTRG